MNLPSVRGRLARARVGLRNFVWKASAGALAVGVATAAWADAPLPKRMTLGEVIEASLVASPAIEIAAAEVSAQELKVSAARAMLFPRLRVEGNVLVWNEEIAFPEEFTALFAALGGGAAGPAPEPIRNQVTAGLSVTVAEPLTGLYAIARLMALEEAGVAASAADQQTIRLETAQKVAEAYFVLLTARSFAQVAEKSIEQVEAQHARARALEAAGVLGKVDRLRLDSLRESAKQGFLAARMAEQIAGRGLALVMGVDETIEPVDDFPDPPPSFDFELSSALLLADQRSELVAARARLEQARGGVDVAKAALFPSIVAVATYQRVEGQSFGTQPNTFFGGATLSWDVFEWGKTVDTIGVAHERAHQAEVGLGALKTKIRFDVDRSVLQAKTGFETLSAARAGLAAAEEAHRIQSVRFEQGAATTTDVIDAETDLARARSQNAAARYNYYLSLATAARALGRLPNETSKETQP